jgi:pilus assembly protein CpaE
VPKVSVINPNETAKSWKASKREPTVHLYVSGVEGDAGALAGARVGDFALSLEIVPVNEWINPEELSDAVAAVIQVDPDTPSSIKRFQKLAAAVSIPLIAAAYEPPLALVRSLIRAGAHDVLPLPLTLDELETSIATLADRLSAPSARGSVENGKLVSVIKSVGGVGATALLTQLAIRFAANEAAHNREACILDLDVQFGDVAFQLGLQPKLSLADLLEAGGRLDGDLIRATTTEHRSGLKLVAAPTEMMPLEGLSNEHLMRIVELATHEFGTVFLDLPTNWTNWSLSFVARSDLVLLVTELTVAGLNRAKRQLELLESQGLGNLDVRIVVNRFEKSLSRQIRPSDVRAALHRDVAYTVGNDFALIRTAIDRGVPISELKRKSAIGKDLDLLDSGISAALGLER